MNPVQYIIVNTDTARSMSKGKFGAQTAHASVQGLLAHAEHKGVSNPWDVSIVNRWMRGGHYAKVVLETPSNLLVIKQYIEARDFPCALIIDEGRTEIDAMTPTAIGTGVVDKDQGHVRDTFGEFRLYAEPRTWSPHETYCRIAQDDRKAAAKLVFNMGKMLLTPKPYIKEKGDAR